MTEMKDKEFSLAVTTQAYEMEEICQNESSGFFNGVWRILSQWKLCFWNTFSVPFQMQRDGFISVLGCNGINFERWKNQTKMNDATNFLPEKRCWLCQKNSLTHQLSQGDRAKNSWGIKFWKLEEQDRNKNRWMSQRGKIEI